MSRILFTHSFFYRFDKKQWKGRKYYPPLGTITSAAFIREKGHKVSLFDVSLAESASGIESEIINFQPEFIVIYDDWFNYLTKMCLVLMREAAFDLIKIGKKMGCRVIVSSSDSSDHYDKYLNIGADIILIGEGEISLSEVLDCFIKKNTHLKSVKGIAYRFEGRTILTGKREVNRNLDLMPIAAWDLVDIERYKKVWIRNHGYFSLNVASSRGCSYNCNWCAKPVFGNHYNARSPENFFREIEFLVRTYGAEYFWICDDIFGLNIEWIKKFRDIAATKNIRFKYMMQSRPDILLQDETIKALAESGLDIVWIGAESGSQKILDAMEKKIKVNQIFEAHKKLSDYGIRTAFFLQFGYLGETLHDIGLTEKMLFDLMPDDIGISVSYPLPGTPFYENVKADIELKANWCDSDDLELLFNNTFSPLFYRMLHRYIHKKFRKKQGFNRLCRFMHNPVKNRKGILRTLIAVIYYIYAEQFYRIKMNAEQKKRCNV